MPASQASIGYGTVLEIALASSPSAFTYIAETKSHTPPSFTDSTVEVTHMQSPNRTREFIAGLVDAGESSHEMNYIPGSVSDAFIRSIAGQNLVVRLSFPNGRQMIYNAVRSGYEVDVPTDEGMTATLTLKVSGDPALTAVAAPRNLAVPTITGVAKVGIPLVVDSGVWAGAKSLTYQWRVDGTNVSGATGSTYVPVTGDVGKAVTVQVTGVNDSFNTVVTSVATSNVVA